MQFTYEIKKSKGRSIRISINRQGEVFLHVPRLVPQFVAKRFLQDKKEWVIEKIKEQKARMQKSPTAPFERGTLSAKARRLEYLAKKEEARKLVLEKLEYWKYFYGTNFQIDFNWKNVSIKNSKTRWGSCSSKKNLNFSYRVLELTQNQQDYLIVHELCHLQQMNHSEKFWNLVSLGIPNFKSIRKQMKKFSLS